MTVAVRETVQVISSSFEEDLLTGLSGLYDNEMVHAVRQIEELSPAYPQVIQASDTAHGGERGWRA